MVLDEIKWTQTQRKFINLLRDGRPHLRSEFSKIVAPSGEVAVRMMLSAIRKKIRPKGMDVLTFHNGQGPRKIMLVRLFSDD